MTVAELIEQLQKLDPSLHCYIMDTDADMYRIVGVREEDHTTTDGKNIAYFEALWADTDFKDSKYDSSRID